MINKAAPGFFPEIRYELSDYNDVRHDDDPNCSIDTKLFDQMCQKIPSDIESSLQSDRFCLSRIYLAGNTSALSALNSTDFGQFKKNSDREYVLRNKLKEYLANSSESGIPLPQFNHLDTVLTRGYDVVRTQNRRWRNTITDLFNRKKRAGSRSSRYEFGVPQLDSLISTEIIDNVGPEVDFIDFKYEKNGITQIQEVATSSYNDDFTDDGNNNSNDKNNNNSDNSNGNNININKGKNRNATRRRTQRNVTLQRKLKIRHLQMISLGATIGVGLFLNSGRAFSIAGPMGAFLGFLYGAFVILATLFSFAEILAFIPMISGISGLCSRFVSDSFGFTVGWCHWLSYAVAFPSELIASAMMISYYKPFEKVATDNSHMAATITILIVVLTGINLLDVRIYGELEYIMSAFKLLVVVSLIILVIILNCGGFKNTSYIGFKFWTKNESPSPDITFGPFRPTYDLEDYGSGSRRGIGGFGGVILSCITCSVSSIFSYIGSEIGFIAAPEAQNPRKTVPSVTKRIFVRVVLFYLLSIFIVGTVIYAGDPRLLRILSDDRKSSDNSIESYMDVINKLGGMNCNSHFSNDNFFNESSNQSPWVIAFKSVKQCELANIINGVFVCIGISAASSQLYASSRTLYSMASQNKAPIVFTYCFKNGVPYTAVLFCGALGFLSLLCLDLRSTEALLLFVSIGSTGSVIMWLGMNLSFLRFYLALKRRPDIIDRNSKEYPYKSPFQPYLCIFGIVSTTLLLLMSGIQNFFVWKTSNFISSYMIIVIFVVLYVGYSIVRNSSIHHLEQIDLDSGRREMDRVLWIEDANYTLNVREVFHEIFSYV